MSGASVREALVDDAAAIAAITVRGWQVGYRGVLAHEVLARQSLAGHEALLRPALAGRGRDQRRILVAVDAAGAIVGFCGFRPELVAEPPEPHIGEISDLYVDPPYWGRSVGRGLLRAALHRLRQLGRSGVALWTFVGNDRALRFYESAGFVADGGDMNHPNNGHRMIRLRLEL
jgi:ribosomal protein S18 acetylase RimI-like enzyme